MSEPTLRQKAGQIICDLGWEKELRDLDQEDDATLNELIRILEEPSPPDLPNREYYESLSRYGIREARQALAVRATRRGAP